MSRFLSVIASLLSLLGFQDPNRSDHEIVYLNIFADSSYLRTYDLNDVIKIHRTDLDYIKDYDIWGTKLVFKNGYLDEKYEILDGIEYRTELSLWEKEVQLKKHPINTALALKRDNSGKNYLGGNCPENFQIPILKNQFPFQYLGMISNNDENFNWLPFDLHIIYPQQINHSPIFLDYSNANAPKVIDEEKIEIYWSDDDFEISSFISYKQVYFTTSKLRKGSSELRIGRAGIPEWIQNSPILYSPVEKTQMKFVCQINSEIGIEVNESNIKFSSEYNRKSYESMNFHSSGTLYIFFDAKSKTACLIKQYT